MTAGTVYTQATGSATATGDPIPSCQSDVGHGVWYAYTPAASGQVALSTCDSDYDTVLAVYTGACGSLTAVACSDDDGPLCSGTRASLTFNASAGTTYLILAAGYSSESGTLKISVSVPVPNDRCSGALAMTAGTVYTQATGSATATGDPIPSCQSDVGHGVWYAYTPAASGQVALSTCDSDYDTVLAVYTGACGSLTAVACSDDDGPLCSGTRASLTFNASAGTTYLILAAGHASESGTLKIVVREEPPPQPRIRYTLQPGALILAWPADSGQGFILETSDSLSPGVVWKQASGTPVLIGSDYVLTIESPKSTRFYRLFKP